MKLFLASLASATLDLVYPLLPDKPSSLKLAFIPTAADPYPADSRPWMDGDRAKLVEMGFAVTDYDLKNKNVDILSSELSPFHVIFVAGGNTYYLLNEVKKSGFDIVIKELIDKGTVYIGSSAGSIIMGSDIEYAKSLEMPVPALTNFSGLNLIKKLLIPHYGREKYALRHRALLDDLSLRYQDNIVLPLRDDQAVIVNDGETKIVTN